MDLTDAQWAFLEPLFRPRRQEDGEADRGKTRVRC
jgi:transposase